MKYIKLFVLALVLWASVVAPAAAMPPVPGCYPCRV